MDINVGGSKPSAVHKMRRLYNRLTTKGKIVFGILFCLVLYLVMPSWSSSSKSNDKGAANYYTRSNQNDNRLTQNKENEVYVSSNNMKTLSDLLHHSPKVNPISLNYLSLPPYLDSDLKFPHYNNGGNMLLSKTSDFVRLVRDSPKNSGYVFSKVPISVNDLSAIEIQVEFQISGEQEKISLIGDGMGIWLTSEPLKQGDVFGMQGDFNGLGMFIDTYKNQNGKRNRNTFPYLSIQRNRGDPNFYNKGMDGIDSQFGGCSVSDIYNNEKPSKFKFTYIRQAKVFEVNVDTTGDGNWKTCFRKENLDVDDILPVGKPIYLGVSAETGDLHHNVDLKEINVTTFRLNDNNKLIDEIDTLGEGIKIVESEKEEEEYENLNNQGSSNLKRRRNRRTINRLRKQEKKLKEKDLEKYNNHSGFVGWFFHILWKIFKTVVIICVAAYACLIGYRVYKEKRKQKYQGGLL